MQKSAESAMKDARSVETSYDVHSVAFPCVGKCVANNPAFPNGMGEISVLIDTELWLYLLLEFVLHYKPCLVLWNINLGSSPYMLFSRRPLFKYTVG